ncbi:MAG: hypothetical protein JWO12_2241 [Frankiales bacterium]|nr:hypothetical protein [Frankiales bacterium]
MCCCGSPCHEITLRVGANDLALQRCTSCGDQTWARDGAVLARTEAFDVLASAYREDRVRDQAARERTARATAARQAARLADREAAPGTPSPQAPRDAASLTSLLDGWQVLGAPA